MTLLEVAIPEHFCGVFKNFFWEDLIFHIIKKGWQLLCKALISVFENEMTGEKQIWEYAG